MYCYYNSHGSPDAVAPTEATSLSQGMLSVERLRMEMEWEDKEAPGAMVL